jgi:uridylate kinase
MLATMVNALVLQNIMHQEGIKSSVFSAIEMPRYIKTINKISAVKRLES